MPDAPLTHAEQIALLQAAIARSGLSPAQYAKQVLVRDFRTIQRWLSGEKQIPKAVLDLISRERVA